MGFTSIPGMNHAGQRDRRREPTAGGDAPAFVDHPVIDPDTGRELYRRQVFEPGFAPGMDEGDGIHFKGQRMEKVHDEYDRANARTSTVYRLYREDGRPDREIVIDHEQDSEREDVVARHRTHR